MSDAPAADLSRDRWIERTAERLFDALGDAHDPEIFPESNFTREQCSALAEFAYDLNTDERDGLRGPRQLMHEKLLSMQGIDSASAALMSGWLPKIDLNSLTVGAVPTGEILGITPVSLIRHKQYGRWLPAIDKKSGGRSQHVVYHLADVLYALTYRHQHPHPGGRTVWLPPDLGGTM